MPVSKGHEFDDIVQAARSEIAADVPKLRTGLDLTADASKASEADMVKQVQQGWGSPEYRHDLVQRESPDNVLHLLLRANGVSNADGSPMTVNQYQKTVLDPFVQTGQSPFIKPALPPNPVAPAPVTAPAPLPAAPPAAPPPQILGPNGQPLPPSPPAAAAPPAAPPMEAAPL